MIEALFYFNETQNGLYALVLVFEGAHKATRPVVDAKNGIAALHSHWTDQFAQLRLHSSAHQLLAVQALLIRVEMHLALACRRAVTRAQMG